MRTLNTRLRDRISNLQLGKRSGMQDAATKAEEGPGGTYVRATQSDENVESQRRKNEQRLFQIQVVKEFRDTQAIYGPVRQGTEC